MEIATITPADAAARCGEGGELIDVRTPAEFREVHATIARNVPLDRLDPAALMQARNGRSGQPIYLICRSGSRSRHACEKFVKAGYTDVVNVEGGTLAWQQSGLPVVRGKKTISLERQVRIAAGLLVCLGVVLGSARESRFFGSVVLRRRRPALRRRDGHVRHGHAAGPDALESWHRSKGMLQVVGKEAGTL